MSDTTVLEQLRNLVGSAVPHTLDNGVCTELRLSSESALVHGLIRNHTPAAKLEILTLVSRLRQLRRLDLRRNLLRDLPAELGELTQLEHLVLGSNYLGKVPEFVRRFSGLKSLHMGNNDLVELPAWICELRQLEYVALHKNLKLRVIDSLAGLSKLRNLNLYFVPINTLPEFVYELRELSTLSMWNVCRYPHPLDALPSLQYFTLCGTPSLHSLPPGFTRITGLRMARLFQNNLDALPDDMGNLRNLEQISLYQNRLSQLPDSMANLNRLEKLNLGWNRLQSIPDWLPLLPGLSWLGLFENPIANPDPSRFRPTVRVDWKWPFSTPRSA